VEVPWVPHIYRDTIVCYSFSKSLSLPGERIGYVFVPKEAAEGDDVYAAVAWAM
jgi:aspartate aminotransferase